MLKKLILPIVVLCIIAVGIVLALNSGCKGSECEINITEPTPTISLVQQVESDMQAGALLIDVRTPEEYALEHAKDAINLPLVDIQNGIFPTVSQNTKLYLYCHSGNQAEQAKIALENAGFANVINIGGLSDWQVQGSQVISD